MRLIGFFKELDPRNPAVYTEELSNPGAEQPDYPKSDVVRYLSAGYPILDVMEGTSDVIGSAFRVPGGSSVVSDGTFAWRVDLEHYVQHYEIPLPVEFVSFMRENGFLIPRLSQSRLVEISISVNELLGFHVDPGAAPRNERSSN
ncbi:hypothetical protein ACIQXD_03530 [Streptomyces uncialis]|uniref:hypothetical protein n=1 Tax=Streptomyces uncialis TaxID=1048205 RepID=UPI0038160FD1